MSLAFIYAASLVTTFVAWYMCTGLSSRAVRVVARATVIASLCSPGILIGHGVGVAPTLLALYLQPSIFTLASILAVWIITLTVLFAYSYGDSTTNLIQPFWAIPILAVTRLRFGDVVGYLFLVALACFVVSTAAMFWIPPDL